MNKMTVSDLDVSGKRVLVRVDFNVPMDESSGAITDDSRIRATLPTINYLVSHGAKLILCSHLGRPKGKAVDSLRLAPVGRHLAQILGRPVRTAEDSIGERVEKEVGKLGNGEILLLENIRFHPGEEANDPAFAQALARLADIYVNDAFGAAHRAHASTVGITRYLPAVAGFLLKKEVETLGGILASPPRPFATIVGGAKVSDKIEMIENIMGKVDSFLIGGGMAATFLKARSYQVGASLVEDDRLDLSLRLMQDMEKRGVRCLLPVDVVVADGTGPEAKAKTVPVSGIPPGWRIVDIGPKTIGQFCKELEGSRTVFWNGPLGIYEIARFAGGTQAIARCLAGLKARTIIGGGSTAEVVTGMKLADRMTFVSTGGGASLRFLSGKPMPGVEALLDKK
jgi:phosphoglycerate kinase